MRKYIISLCLLLYFSPLVNAQSWEEDMVVARKLVDSVNRELKTAKGEKRIDYLNLLSATYYWIWEENVKHLDSACMYGDQAYELAKKSNYKRGLGYATLRKAHCLSGRVDNNINNNSTEVNYAQAEKWAQQAIKIGEEIKDFRLVGDVYDMLKGMERWKGDNNKSKSYIEKAIYYYEKPVTKKLSALLDISRCDQCSGNEKKLGNLYQTYAQILGSEKKDVSAIKEKIDKAIYYYSKIGNKWGLGVAYQTLAQTANQAINFETGTEYLLKALALFREVKNTRGELDVLRDLSSAYWNMGDFEKGFDIARSSLPLAEKGIKNQYVGSADSFRLGHVYYWLGRFYTVTNDYEAAFAFVRKAQPYFPTNHLLRWRVLMAELHRATGNYDSALYYLNHKAGNLPEGAQFILANVYVSMNQFDKALELVNESKKTADKRNNFVNLGRIYTTAAKAYTGKKEYSLALSNAREGIALLGRTKTNTYLMNGYEIISDIFSRMGRHDSAYFYLKQYMNLKDSFVNRQLYNRLNNYKKEVEEERRTSQIKLLQKDNLLKEQQLLQQILFQQQNIAQLALLNKNNEIIEQQFLLKDQRLQIKEQELKEQLLLKEQQRTKLTLLDKDNRLKDQQLKQQTILKNALIAGLFLLLVLSFFIVTWLSLKRKNERLKSEKKQAELQQQSAELEMQALRAQMNPHFIFNCLSSINRFIYLNDNQTASDYLTRFSRLIRMVLIHSQKNIISLEDELEMLRLYLDMERLRFKNGFDYSIITNNRIDAGALFIPPLILQPFCENAIWHGLMHKDEKGHLKISIKEDDHVLHCTITDDGVGRKRAALLKSKSAEKHKSLGLKITAARLDLYNKQHSEDTSYRIEDLTDENGDIAGTKVHLKINVKQPLEKKQYA